MSDTCANCPEESTHSVPFSRLSSVSSCSLVPLTYFFNHLTVICQKTARSLSAYTISKLSRLTDLTWWMYYLRIAIIFGLNVVVGNIIEGFWIDWILSWTTSLLISKQEKRGVFARKNQHQSPPTKKNPGSPADVINWLGPRPLTARYWTRTSRL